MQTTPAVGLTIVLPPPLAQLELEAEGTDSVAQIKAMIFSRQSEAHPALQRLVHEGRELGAEDEARSLEQCSIRHGTVLQVALRPRAVQVELCVGGVAHATTLDTLLACPGSRICEMFEGMRQGGEPCFPTRVRTCFGRGGVTEGKRRRLGPAGPLPRCGSAGAYIIDRNGGVFGHVLDYLRTGRAVLPPQPHERAQLALEAEYYGLEALAEAAGGGSLASVAAGCGGGATVADIAGLSDDAVAEVLREQRVSRVWWGRIQAEVVAERKRLDAERTRAALAVVAEHERLDAERTLAALAAALAGQGAQLSEAGLGALIAAGHADILAVSRLGAAAAERLGLAAEDARAVGALDSGEASEAAVTFGYTAGNVAAASRGTRTCAFTAGAGPARSPALGSATLEVGRGAVFWKATVHELNANGALGLGVLGAARPASGVSFVDPTSFGWGSNGGVVTGGAHAYGSQGWQGFAAGDVAVFKLEAHQLSMRVRRLGDATFTVPTGGTPDLRAHVYMCGHPTRVELSREVAAHERY